MKLTGNLEDLGLGEILQILSFSSKSGVLRLRTAKMSGIIVLKDGSIIKATSGSVKSGIGEVLLKERTVTEETLDAARRTQKEEGYGLTIARVLSDKFGVPEDKINEAGRRLIEKIVYSFFLWQDGNFVFELGVYRDTPANIKKDPVQITLVQGLNPQFLAMEGLRLVDEARRTGGIISKGADEEQEDAQEDAPPSVEPVCEAPQAGCEEAPERELEDKREASYLNDLLREISEEVCIPEPGAEAVARIPESKGLKVLKEMLEELARPMSFNEMILLILRFSSEIFNRSVVFAVKDGFIVGFGQFGVEIDGSSADSRVRNMRIPIAEHSVLKEAIDTKKTVVKSLDDSRWNRYIVEQLGGHQPVEAFVEPIVVKDEVAMLVYGDNLPDDRRLDDLSAFEIFICQTSIAMEGILSKNNAVRQVV